MSRCANSPAAFETLTLSYTTANAENPKAIFIPHLPDWMHVLKLRIFFEAGGGVTKIYIHSYTLSFSHFLLLLSIFSLVITKAKYCLFFSRNISGCVSSISREREREKVNNTFAIGI